MECWSPGCKKRKNNYSKEKAGPFLTMRSFEMIPAKSHSLWADYGILVLKSAIMLMAIAAVIWLGYEYWRLIRQSGEMGAIDLRQRHYEMQAWFASKPVYGDIVTAVYPPASYAIL